MINDEFGHLFGDEIIKIVSSTCLELIGENEMLGRYGGDEFVAILNQSSLDSGRLKAEQIGNAFRNLGIQKDGKMVGITSSIGVSTNLSGSLRSFDELFHNADLALYKAKQNGKNQIFISDDNLEKMK